MLIGDARVGAKADELLRQRQVTVLGRDVQRGMPGIVTGEVAAPKRVDVEPGRDEQLDGVGSALRRGPSH